MEATHRCVVCQGADVLFWALFPSCRCVPSSQMDAVKQLNDACFPSWALTLAAVYMQGDRQTSRNTCALIFVWVLQHSNLDTHKWKFVSFEMRYRRYGENFQFENYNRCVLGCDMVLYSTKYSSKKDYVLFLMVYWGWYMKYLLRNSPISSVIYNIFVEFNISRLTITNCWKQFRKVTVAGLFNQFKSSYTLIVPVFSSWCLMLTNQGSFFRLCTWCDCKVSCWSRMRRHKRSRFRQPEQVEA